MKTQLSETTSLLFKNKKHVSSVVQVTLTVVALDMAPPPTKDVWKR